MARRSWSSSRRPLWIIILIAFVCAVGLGAYLYTPRHYTACYLVSSDACSSQPPPEPARVYTDDEIAARAIMRDITRARPVQSRNPKIAFMFLTPSSLPFEKLWEKFFMTLARRLLHPLPSSGAYSFCLCLISGGLVFDDVEEVVKQRSVNKFSFMATLQGYFRLFKWGKPTVMALKASKIEWMAHKEV